MDKQGIFVLIFLLPSQSSEAWLLFRNHKETTWENANESCIQKGQKLLDLSKKRLHVLPTEGDSLLHNDDSDGVWINMKWTSGIQHVNGKVYDTEGQLNHVGKENDTCVWYNEKRLYTGDCKIRRNTMCLKDKKVLCAVEGKTWTEAVEFCRMNDSYPPPPRKNVIAAHAKCSDRGYPGFWTGGKFVNQTMTYDRQTGYQLPNEDSILCELTSGVDYKSSCGLLRGERKKPHCTLVSCHEQHPFICMLTELCPQLELKSPEGVKIRFNKSPPGNATSELSCFTTGQPFATATCSSAANGHNWTAVNWIPCPTEMATKYTEEFKTLADAFISRHNVTSASWKLSDLTVNALEFSSTDITYAALAVSHVADTVGEVADSTNVTTNIVETVSNLMNANTEVLQKAVKHNSVTNFIITALDKVTGALHVTNKTSVVRPNVALTSVALSNTDEFGFGVLQNFSTNKVISIANHSTSFNSMDSVVMLPVDELRHRFDDDITASIIAYRTNALFSQQTLVSHVVSAGIKGLAVRNLQKPVVIRFLPLTKPDKGNITCVFWNLTGNFGKGTWSEKGCFFKGWEGRHIVCHCSHMTNFAVLIDWSQTGHSLEHQTALSVITITGLSVSSAALVLSLFTIALTKRLRKERRYKIVFNLAIMLLFANLLILLGLDKTWSYPLCCSVAALLLFTLLAAFCWMFIQVLYLYLNFVKVLGTHTSHFVLKAGILAYGLPACIVGIVAAADIRQFRGKLNSYCWLQQEAFRYAFMLPILVIVCVNIGLFVRVMVTVWHRPKGLRTNQHKGQQRRLQVTASAACFVVTGATWLFAFVAIAEARLVFQYLFCILSSLQGLLIFVLHVASDRKTRQRWSKIGKAKTSDKTSRSLGTLTTNASVQSCDTTKDIST